MIRRLQLVPARPVSPTVCRLQVGDTADCPSPLRFDATAPKPEAKAGKSALQFSHRRANQVRGGGSALKTWKAMLDKILFWVVLVWMVALLGMAIWAVREVIKEDGRFPTDDAGTAPGSAPEESKDSGASASSDNAGGLKS